MSHRSNSFGEIMSTQPTADPVRSMKETAALCGMSYSTFRREIERGNGPKITQLSTRRFGVRESHRLAWLDSRVVSQAA